MSMEIVLANRPDIQTEMRPVVEDQVKKGIRWLQIARTKRRFWGFHITDRQAQLFEVQGRHQLRNSVFDAVVIGLDLDTRTKVRAQRVLSW